MLRGVHLMSSLYESNKFIAMAADDDEEKLLQKFRIFVWKWKLLSLFPTSLPELVFQGQEENFLLSFVILSWGERQKKVLIRCPRKEDFASGDGIGQKKRLAASWSIRDEKEPRIMEMFLS